MRTDQRSVNALGSSLIRPLGREMGLIYGLHPLEEDELTSRKRLET